MPIYKQKSRNHSFINAYDFCSLLKLMTLNTYMVSDKPVATIRTATLQIDISNEISDALLSRIIQEVSHA